MDVGSAVFAGAPKSLGKGDTGEVIVQIKAWDQSTRPASGILDVFFEKGLVLVAVPDDRVDADYDNIEMEYFKEGEWHTVPSSGEPIDVEEEV